MQTFRLVHVSDLHFSARPNAVNPFIGATGLRVPDFALWRHFRNAVLLGPSTFSSALATHLSLYLGSVQDEIDAIVATGDLATTGKEADLKVAKGYFLRGQPASVVFPQFAARFSSNKSPDLPIIFMPGNHDRYQGSMIMPGGKVFEKVFGQSWDADQRNIQFRGRGVRALVLGKEDEYLAI